MTSWPKPPAQKLTPREWEAIEEALNFRLAGPISDSEVEPLTRENYEQAHRKVMQRIR